MLEVAHTWVCIGLPKVSNVSVKPVTVPVQPLASKFAPKDCVPDETFGRENENEVLSCVMELEMLVNADFNPATIALALPALK